MDYGRLIRESFNIFWKHKSLWVFGVMAAFFGQNDYGFSVNYRESVSMPVGEDLLSDFPSPFEGTVFADFFNNPLPYIIVFAIIGLGWWVISNIFGWLAQGALIGMVDEVDQAGSTSIGKGWQTGQERLIPLFLMAIVLSLPMLLVLIVAISLVFPIFYRLFVTGSPDPSLILPSIFSILACLFPLICIGAFMGFVLNLLNTMAARSCVLEGLGVIDSIKRGRQIIWGNIGYTLLTWFLLIVTSSTFGFAAALPALILWVPVARAMLHNNWSALSVAGAVTVGCYFLVVGVGLGGILTSFNSTLWTKLYKAFMAREEALKTVSV